MSKTMHNVHPALQASCFTQLRHETRSHQLHLQNNKISHLCQWGISSNTVKGLLERKCRDTGEPCGAIRDGKGEGRVVGFGDGAIEPPWSYWVAESRLLEWVGGVQNSERCFHQGFFVSPHLDMLKNENFSIQLLRPNFKIVWIEFFFWRMKVKCIINALNKTFVKKSKL